MTEYKNEFIWEKIVSCIYSIFLLVFITIGMGLGEWVGYRLNVSNFMICPWLGGFLGCTLADMLTRVRIEKRESKKEASASESHATNKKAA